MSPLPITGMAASGALTEDFALTGKLPLKLDETVVPVVSVGDLADDVWGPLAAGSITVPAAAGFRSEIEFSLPQLLSSQGAVVRLESVMLLGTVAGMLYSFSPSPGIPAPTTVVGLKAWQDVGRAGDPAAIILGKNNAAGTAGFVDVLRIYLRLHESLTVPLRWLLRAPAGAAVPQGIMIRSAAVNQDLRANFFWRERAPR